MAPRHTSTHTSIMLLSGYLGDTTWNSRVSLGYASSPSSGKRTSGSFATSMRRGNPLLRLLDWGCCVSGASAMAVRCCAREGLIRCCFCGVKELCR